MKKLKPPIFKQIEIQLKLQELEDFEEKWDVASKKYKGNSAVSKRKSATCVSGPRKIAIVMVL